MAITFADDDSEMASVHWTTGGPRLIPSDRQTLRQFLVLLDHAQERIPNAGENRVVSEVSNAVRLFAIVAYQLDREVSHGGVMIRRDL
jgi:hypothetical protein